MIELEQKQAIAEYIRNLIKDNSDEFIPHVDVYRDDLHVDISKPTEEQCIWTGVELNMITTYCGYIDMWHISIKIDKDTILIGPNTTSIASDIQYTDCINIADPNCFNVLISNLKIIINQTSEIRHKNSIANGLKLVEPWKKNS